MKSLGGDFASGSDFVDSIIRGFTFRKRQSLKADDLRRALAGAGCKVKRLAPSPRKARFLAADCAIAFKELRYHALWAAHAVAVSALYDGKRHRDMVVGNGTLPYDSLLHSGYVGVGEFVPYSDIDVRGNCARVDFEFGSLLRARDELCSEGIVPDYTLVDGSLYTNLSNLKAKDGDFPEAKRAGVSFRGALSSGKVVGMVEDSHATDLARELGFDFTNMLLFDVALDAGEYVVDLREGISICYLKLPPKAMPHLPSGRSPPLTVRWEFNWDDFEDSLNLLAGIWLEEDDVLHPQIYPLRIADYLTRTVKVGGILDEIVAGNNMELKYRELREG
jgi:hypothetical protein